MRSIVLVVLVSCGGIVDASVSSSDGGTADPTVDAPTGDACRTCTVSFTRDIFSRMLPTGPWKCMSGPCHGGVASPRFFDLVPTYQALPATAYTPDLRYVVPCDPGSSAMIGNLRGTIGRRMPIESTQLGSRAATSEEIEWIASWIACGAPLN